MFIRYMGTDANETRSGAAPATRISWGDLRRGRSPRLATADRILAFMEAYDRTSHGDHGPSQSKRLGCVLAVVLEAPALVARASIRLPRRDLLRARGLQLDGHPHYLPAELPGARDGRGAMTAHLRGRESALEPFGWTGRQAEWIALACLHSGVFTRA